MSHDNGSLDRHAGLDEVAYSVIGAAIEVHRVLGPGYLEGVYEDAMCVELTSRGVALERQVRLDLSYKGQRITSARLDLVIEKRLVVELKTVTHSPPFTLRSCSRT